MKPIFLTTVLVCCVSVTSAQWELVFCATDSAGACYGKADLFVWNGERVAVFARLESKKGFTEGKLLFKIFEMENDFSGEIYAEVKAAVKAETKFVFKKIYFLKPGYYKVEVYDEKLNRLASEYVTITDRSE